MRIRVWNENCLRAGQLAWDGDEADQSGDSSTITTESAQEAEALAQAYEGRSDAISYHGQLAQTVRDCADYEQPGL